MTDPTQWPPKDYPSTDAPPVEWKPTLVARTFDALRYVIDNRKETLREVATNAGVEWTWLRMFALSRVEDPSCSRIERLYHYLTGRTL